MRQTKTLSPASVVPIPMSLCRLPPAPAGNWPFPTLSLQSLRRCLDPCPAVSSKCACSLLPWRQRPHLRRHRFGTPNYPCNATLTGNSFSRLQSFHYVQAPTLAGPPGCTHRCGTMPTGQPGRLHHASPGWLPAPGCGITTCPTRATDTLGIEMRRAQSAGREFPTRTLSVCAAGS
jgi:hypothetical protein